MRRRAFLGSAALLLLAGCVVRQDPRPGPIRAMEPRPNPTVRAAVPEAPRRGPWVTRFWEELSPAQRRLVAARLRRASPSRAASAAEARSAWDVMGLPEREVLIQGRTAPAATAGGAPPEWRAEAEGVTPKATR